MATSPNVLHDDAAPIVDFDVIEEGVDEFYECNNNNAKNIAMCETKRGLVSELTSGGNGMRTETCRLDSDSLTDLFLKKYHAHNELIENNLYCINTKKIEETIDQIDLGDGDVFRPVVIDTRQEAQVSEVDDNRKEQLSNSNGNNLDHNIQPIVSDRNFVYASNEREASLLDLTEDGFNGVVNSLLGDTVCTNHLLADVRDDFERLKVNVDELNEQFRFNCDGESDTTAHSIQAPHGDECYGRKESDPNQLVNSIINQSDTKSHRAAGKQATRSKSTDGYDLTATSQFIDALNEHGKLIFFFIIHLYLFISLLLYRLWRPTGLFILNEIYAYS